MKRAAMLLSFTSIVTIVAVMAWVIQPRVGAAGGGGAERILEFGTMVGVSGPFKGAANAIREIGGGGADWVISRGEGELRTNGEIKVKVEGLVLVRTGTNPVAQFKATVSCLSIDEHGDPVTVNVDTALFPADADGNSEIEDQVDLPTPCFAPIIFITIPQGRWIAVTGS